MRDQELKQERDPKKKIEGQKSPPGVEGGGDKEIQKKGKKQETLKKKKFSVW